MTADNVIVQYAKHKTIDDYGRRAVALIGTGNGYYITRGKYIPVTWEKKERSSSTKFFDSEGNEILFNVGENEELNNKFDQIKNKINNSNFAEAALIYSVSDTAKKGGELGWINESSLSNKIKDKLQDINIGNYSNPILIPGGFIILKIENIKEVEINIDQDKEIDKIIKDKTNEQLNQFSNIFFNKIQKNIKINEF